LPILRSASPDRVRYRQAIARTKYDSASCVANDG
jgi:hypothetical protein